ncbi:MAG: transporter substrate-binding domain-containing protein [Motiliproteus sp.]
MYTAHPDYPPYQWQDGNNIVGASSDIMKLILNELEIPYESRFVGPWVRVLANVRAGSVDMVLALKKVPERQEYMTFTDTPFYQNPMAVFTVSGNQADYTQWQDLRDKQVVVQRGDRYGQKFDAFMQQNLTPIIVDSAKSSFRMLQAGRADFFITGLYPGRSYLAAAGLDEQFRALEPYINSGFVHHAFSKKSPCQSLIPYINKRLRELMADGTTARALEENLQYWKKSRNTAQRQDD